MYILVRKMSVMVIYELLKGHPENQALFCKIYDSHDEGLVILNFNYDLMMVDGLLKNLKNRSFIETQMVQGNMFAFPLKTERDPILAKDVELCSVDQAYLKDLNNYPEPALQIVGFVLTPQKISRTKPVKIEKLATVEKKKGINAGDYKTEASPLKKRKTKYYSINLNNVQV